MRTARSLEQKMYYSLQGNKVPVYQTDMYGNIQYYTDADGNQIPLLTGEYKIGYGLPEEMKANIAFSSGEVEAKEFGLSVSDYDASIVTQHGAYPLTETTIIFYNEKPKYTDSTNTVIDEKSATFRIVAVKPSQYLDKYLLKKVTK